MWRTLAFDAAHDLSIGGRYPRLLALPDRWASWYVSAVLRALYIVRQHRPRVIWSTYPIATAHLVAHTVQRLTGLPWIADFRDSMTEPGYPANPWDRRAYLAIERWTVARAHRVVFTTPGTRTMYLERYAGLLRDRTSVIANGYCEDDFEAAERLGPAAQPSASQRLRFIHSGILYPFERDPKPFLDALSSLKRSGTVRASDVEFVFRASGHDETIRRMIRERDVDDLVTLIGPVGYHEALAEMLQSDGLMLFQAANCNHQIPAKLYEYLRAGKPIFALTDRRGDTASVLNAAGTGSIVDLSDANEIAAQLPKFIERVRRGTEPAGDREVIRGFSRIAGARALASLLDAHASVTQESRQ
jgi:glycosyltransferase involved in cell wall biosynthesis